MASQQIKRLATIAAITAALLAPTRAWAIFGMSEDLLAVIRNTVEQIESMRAVASQKVVTEGVAEWQANEEARKEALRIQHSLEQPESTCSSIAAANNGPKVNAAVAAAVGNRSYAAANTSRQLRAVESGGTTYTAQPVQSVENSPQQIIKTYDYVQSNFCTAKDAELKRCARAATKYPGGDIQAGLLFGDGKGSDTQSSDQGDAVDTFINHIVDSMGPEILRNPDWEKTVEGRKYVLLVRQYAAFMSLARQSLDTININHKPIPELGNVSKMESVNQYIATKWSASAIKDRATATDPTFMLRDMAMMDSYRLWMEYENLKGAERQEGLLAGQLSLLTRQVLLPQLTAQKTAATANGNSNGG